MKKALSLFIMLAVGAAASAQIRKDALLIGGQLSYSSINTLYIAMTPPERISKSATMQLSIGKAWKENSVFGVNISYSPSSNDDLVTTSTGITRSHRTTRIYNAGLFYRRYKKIAGDFYFFGEGDANFTRIHQTEIILIGFDSKNTQTGGQLFLVPGISYNILKRLQAEILIPNFFTVRYTHSDSEQNQFYIGTGLNNTNLGYLGVGFHFIL